MDTKPSGFQNGDAVVVLVGLTAGWRKRRAVRRHFRAAFDLPVYVPWIPYPLGCEPAASWLGFVLRRRMRRGRLKRLHVLAYIGGGFLLRKLAAGGLPLPIGRIVYNRGPIQEQVPRALVARVPRILLMIFGRPFLDLASGRYRDLAFPTTELEQGLIVETTASRLARKLGVDQDKTLTRPEGFGRLLPCADAALAVAVSHDEVYDAPVFLDPAISFLKTGCFDPVAKKGFAP